MDKLQSALFKDSSKNGRTVPRNFTELNQAFANIGIPLPSIDPRTIQVFSRGKEEFVFVEGESVGKFDSTDYLMFYDKRNDG